MEIHKHKKEQMQVVKKLIFLLIFINSFQSCFSQERLAGNYIKKDLDSEPSYSFREDANFIQTSYLHLEAQLVFNGTYKLVKDTLYLHYKPKLKKNKSYKFVKKRKIEAAKNKVYLLSKIRLINKNQSASGVSLLIYDKKGELLMGFDSDKKGEYPYLSLYDSKIGHFVFSSLDFQEVKIPASELFGYSSEVDVYLNNSKIEYSQKEGTIKYLVKSHDKEKIKLKNIKTKERVVLYKQ